MCRIPRVMFFICAEWGWKWYVSFLPFIHRSGDWTSYVSTSYKQIMSKLTKGHVHAVLWGDICGNEWLSQRKAIKQLIIKSYEKGLFVKDESSENIS